MKKTKEVKAYQLCPSCEEKVLEMMANDISDRLIKAGALTVTGAEDIPEGDFKLK